jgi:hypothetical protein
MGRSLRLLAGLALGVALASATVVAAAAQPTPPTIKDQNDRRTLNPLVEEAWRSREAVELFRTGERNFVPDPDLISDVVAPPPARPAPVPAPVVPRLTCWLQQRSMAPRRRPPRGRPLDWLKCRKLRCRQRVVDGHHLGPQVAPPASPEQRPPHRCAGEPPALLGGWRQLEHRQRLEFAQLGTHCDPARPGELAQRAAQRVDVPLPAPDQALVRSGQDLDRLGQRAVAGDRPVVVAVGADQLGQHLGVPAVRLGPRAAMPAAVAADHLEVDRIHLVAGCQQRADQQARSVSIPTATCPGFSAWAATRACSLTPAPAHQRSAEPRAGCRPGRAGTDHGGPHPSPPQQTAWRPPLLRAAGCEPEKDPRRPNGSAHRSGGSAVASPSKARAAH